MPEKKKILDLYKEQYEKHVMNDQTVFEMKQRMMQGRKEKISMTKKKVYKGWAIAAAIALVIMILPNTSQTLAYSMGDIPIIGEFFKVITFRNYSYKDEKNVADVVVPEVTMADNADKSVAEAGKKTAEEINAEIRELTDKWVADFKSIMDEEGYHGIKIDYDVIATTDDYFTLKIILFKAAGSGYEEHHFYTIDLNTGEKVELADLFKEGSDYKNIISENIKDQMREQMANDEGVRYFVDSKDYPEWDFKEITDDTAFYVNQNGEVVISFDEGYVAPASMGTVEFIIPKDIVADIIK